MMHRRGSAIALVGALAALLALAPAAMAGTIRYDIGANPLYTVDNEQGIVKITYNGCVTATQRQTINFNMVTNASATATVGFKVLREEGEEPVSAFDPATVALVKGTEQTFAVAYSFTLNTPTDQRTTFRFKLDPENGAGLGEGPGVMVSIPCVLAAPPPSGGLATAPAGPGGAARPVPTAGVIPDVGSVLGAQVAKCISTPRRIRLRKGERTTFDVVVQTNAQGIQNALVRVTLPGGRRVAHRTGNNGIARFTVRPKRSGRAVIQTDVCFGARRVAVAAGRVAARRQAARFTGLGIRGNLKGLHHHGRGGLGTVAAAVFLLALAASPAGAAGPPTVWPAVEELEQPGIASRFAYVDVPAVVRTEPSWSGKKIARLKLKTEDRTDELVAIIARTNDTSGTRWIKVRLPVRPNGTTGWVPRTAVGELRKVPTWLRINLKKRRLILLRGGKVRFRARIGVGKRKWPTPRGTFYVRNRLFGPSLGRIYGPLAFGTSARSPVLTDWPGGGVVGIHGTNQPRLIPGAVSHGCVRLRNRDIKRLGRLMPVGTSITIS